MASIESYQQLLSAVAACEDKKAEDIRILSLDPTESGLSDYFLICNGTNTRQNVAIADEIEIRLKRDFGVYPNSVEGRREGEWVLMDYVDFIVHVFSPEKREYYGLERLRKSATTIRPDELDSELKAKIKDQTGAGRGKAEPLGTPTKVAKSVRATKAPLKKAVGAKTPAQKVLTKKSPSKVAGAKKVSAKRATAKKTAK